MTPSGMLPLAAVLALAALVAAGPATAATTEEPADDTVTWSAVPATAEGDADGRVSFRWTLDPGTRIDDNVLVTNFSAQDVTFALEGSDGVISDDGSFDVLPRGEEPVDGGSWISIAESVTIPAESSELVPFSVGVPDDAVPGDHPAGLVVSLAQSNDAGSGPNVGFDARVGVRVHLRVAGEVQAGVRATDTGTHFVPSWNPFAPGTLVVEHQIVNDGDVRIGAASTLAVTGPFGLPIASMRGGSVDAREILPGESHPVRTEMPVWPLGPIDTSLTAIPQIVGEDQIDGGALSSSSATVTVWAFPWAQLALLAIVAGVVVGTVWMLRRQRRRYAAALQRARAEGVAAAAAAASGPTPPDADPRHGEKGSSDAQGNRSVTQR